MTHPFVYLLTLPKEQLLYNFFQAQLRNPSKGDWSELLKNDLKDFNISDTFEQISNTKEKHFKKKVKETCMKYAFTKLMEIRSRHSKSKVAEYNKLETSGYLRSNIFTVTQSRLLFKIRSRMLDVKMNFKNNYNDDITLLTCDQCNSGEMDDQSHILSCKVLENTKNITVK